MDQLFYDADSMTLVLPAIRDGEVVVAGSNALSIIDLNGKIYMPLQDKTVKVTLKLTKEDSEETQEFHVSVTGKYSDTGANPKPAVIPALAEWYGLKGKMKITDDTVVVVKDERFTDAAGMLIQDLQAIGIELVMGPDDKQKQAIVFAYDDQQGYQKEGYGLTIENNQIVIHAADHVGAFYATRTLHQMLKNNKDHLVDNGYARDYPKYRIRGFMLDVGRKFTSLKGLYDLMRAMSYYKMNDFQIHLNDNAIFLEHFKDASEALKHAYTGFRLESDLQGNGYTLTSTDAFYTKDEFRTFIADAKKYGVTIVPEFDTPGHAMSFVKIRPDLMYPGSIVNDKIDQERAAMLDLGNKETLPFIQSMYNEYLDGDDPVIGDVPVHIGSDEYYGEAEVYRKYVDELLRFIRDDKKRTARVWGSLSIKKGDTPITAKGIQMDVWNTNWAEPQDMLEQGFDIIHIEDHQVYMVPGADYYQDYLDTKKLFTAYEPNKFNNGTVIDESHPQLLGAGFALWNDQIDALENGITSYDMFDRILDALPILAQKIWGTKMTLTYDAFRKLSKALEHMPQTNLRYTVPSVTQTIVAYDFSKGTKDDSGNLYHVKKEFNASLEDGVRFNGIDSYLETPLTSVGPNVTLEVELVLDQVDTQQILLEADNGGTIHVVNEQGKIGYTYENNTYTFDYQMVPLQKTKLTFITSLHQTRLLVDGKEVPVTQETAKPFQTFPLPVQRIGGMHQTIDGVVKTFKLFKSL